MHIPRSLQPPTDEGLPWDHGGSKTRRRLSRRTFAADANPGILGAYIDENPEAFFLFSVAICYSASTLSAQIVPAADRDVDRFREQAFISYNPRYSELRAERIRRAVSLGKRVIQMEAHERNTTCAHQILTETKWLLGDSADFRRIDQRLDALENVLDHPISETLRQGRIRVTAVGVVATRNGSLNSTPVTNT